MPYFGGTAVPAPPEGTNTLVFTLSEVYATGGLTEAGALLPAPPGTKSLTLMDI